MRHFLFVAQYCLLAMGLSSHAYRVAFSDEPSQPKLPGLFDSAEGQNAKRLYEAVLLPAPANVEAIQRIVDSGVDVDSQAASGDTALVFASVVNTRVEVVRKLVSLGADVNHCSDTITSPLSRSVLAGAYDVAEELVKSKASVSLASTSGRLPLHFAGGNVCSAISRDPGQRSNAKCIDLLVKHGADIRAVCPRKRSCLHYAVLYGNEETVAHLLKTYGGKLDVNARDKYEQTPLMCLLNPRHGAVPRSELTEDEVLSIAESLLKAGADPYLADSSNGEPGFDAFQISKERSEKLRELVSKYKRPKEDQ